MQTGMTIEGLLTEVQRQANVKRDFVASTAEHIRMVAMPDFPDGVAVVLQAVQAAIDTQEPETIETATALAASGPLQRLKVDEHAHRQIAERLQIPWRYYFRMLRDHTDIVIKSVNALFEREPSTRLLRTLDGRLRAFLSNRYRRIDNDTVLGAALPPIVKGDLPNALLSANVTDRNLYLKVVFTGPELRQEIGTAPDGSPDYVRPGFSLRNSEIGTGKVSVSGFFYRSFCYNGCVFGKTDGFEFSRSHLGGALIAGSDFEVMSDKSKELEDAAILSQVSDVMTAIATPEFVNAMGDKLRALRTGEVITNPVPAVELLSNDYGLTQGEENQVLQNLIEDKDYSRWGVVNAVTKVANNEATDYDRASDLEIMGAKLIDITNANWSRLVNAEPVAA